MKKFFLNKLTALLVLTLVFTACDDDDPEVVNEEEVITTMNVSLTDGTNTINFQYRDPDGEDGPDPGVFTPATVMLNANTTYTGSITLLNETETPTEDKTGEIRDEDDEHQFFFEFDGGLFANAVEYLDFDDDQNPLGLSFRLTTGNAGAMGTFTITLIHEPNKTAPGVSDGNIANAGGETDIAVPFDVEVQ